MGQLDRGALGFIKQRQDQSILRVVLDVGSMGGVVPWPERPPLAGRLPLAPGQIDNDLILCQRGGNVEHVDQ